MQVGGPDKGTGKPLRASRTVHHGTVFPAQSGCGDALAQSECALRLCHGPPSPSLERETSILAHSMRVPVSNLLKIRRWLNEAEVEIEQRTWGLPAGVVEGQTSNVAQTGADLAASVLFAGKWDAAHGAWLPTEPRHRRISPAQVLGRCLLDVGEQFFRHFERRRQGVTFHAAVSLAKACAVASR